MSVLDKDRNPFIIPDGPSAKTERTIKGCPKCGHENFVGRRVGGVVTFTCGDTKCGNKWQGGLPREPIPPTEPQMPQNPATRPAVQFLKDSKGQDVEVRRRINPTPEFKKGAPVPSGEEDV